MTTFQDQPSVPNFQMQVMHEGLKCLLPGFETRLYWLPEDSRGRNGGLCCAVLVLHLSDGPAERTFAVL